MANTHSLDLSGSSQYASITDAAQTGLDLSGDFTMEAWIKLDSAVSAGLKPIVVKDNGQPNRSYAFYLQDSGGTDRIGILTSQNGQNATSFNLTVAALSNFSTGVYYHVSVVYDASAGQMEAYVDGVSQGTASGSNSTINNSNVPVHIGAWASGGSPYFDGLLDEIRIWNDIRTSTEINDNMEVELVGDEANLVAYWKFNNNYTDETANGNDLTASGSPTFSTDVPFTGTAYTLELTETVTVTDSVARQAQKSLQEAVAVADTVRRNASKTITEAVTVVDDIAANLILSKSLQEAITITDDVVAQITAKILTEAITVGDSLSRITSKTLTEVANVTDTVSNVLVYVRSLTEAITITDNTIRSTGKLLTETVTAEDTVNFIKVFNRELEETVTIVDTARRDVTRFFTETVAITDTVTTVGVFARQLLESVGITDRLAAFKNGINIRNVAKYINKPVSGAAKYANKSLTYIRKYLSH